MGLSGPHGIWHIIALLDPLSCCGKISCNLWAGVEHFHLWASSTGIRGCCCCCCCCCFPEIGTVFNARTKQTQQNLTLTGENTQTLSLIIRLETRREQENDHTHTQINTTICPEYRRKRKAEEKICFVHFIRSILCLILRPRSSSSCPPVWHSFVTQGC